MTPETRYARLGDLHLAYQALGEGPPDILMLDQWFSHMDAQWDVLPLATVRERLAEGARLPPRPPRPRLSRRLPRARPRQRPPRPPERFD